MTHQLNVFQYWMYWLFNILPKKYGHRTHEGIWYDTYHNKQTGMKYAFEKSTGIFFERDKT